MKNDSAYSITLDSYFDRIFYINLKKDTQRNASIIGQFRKYKLENFERIEAIEVLQLPPAEHYRNFLKEKNKSIPAQLSCRASHIHIIKTARERNYHKILILEDDVMFLQDPNKLLSLNETVLRDWDLLYFGGEIEPAFRNQIVRTHAYAVKNTLYDDIINMAEASGMEIDNFYAKIIQHMSYNYNPSGKYDVKIILPFNSIAPSDTFGSNIQMNI